MAERDEEAEAPAIADRAPAPAMVTLQRVKMEEDTAPVQPVQAERRPNQPTAAKAKPPSFGLPPGPPPPSAAVNQATFNGFAANLMMQTNLAKEAHQLAGTMKEQEPIPKKEGNGPM